MTRARYWDLMARCKRHWLDSGRRIWLDRAIRLQVLWEGIDGAPQGGAP